jgi:NTP pyrophosphatase (non-canonical NTP hydrolase)
MGLQVLEERIINWGHEKGILPSPDPVAQFRKTLEEVEELAIGIDKKDVDEVKDAIGDIIVTLIMQAEAWELNIEQCLQSAYDEIKGRTGSMIDGVFVKDA